MVKMGGVEGAGMADTDWSEFTLDPARVNTADQSVLSAQSAQRRKTQSEKRGSYFLKGPVRFSWIIANIPDPTSRLILVARAFMDMEGRDECVLSQKVWACANISGKDQRRRVLGKIAKFSSDYQIDSRSGRASVLASKKI